MCHPFTRTAVDHTPSWALVLLCVLFIAVDAQAQQPPVPYVQSNQGLQGFMDGPGVRLRTPKTRGINAGEFLIWPSLIVEGRWDSNVFLQHPDDAPPPGAQILATPVLRVVPSLAISNPNPNKFALNLGAETDIRLYLSSDNNVKEQTNFAAKGDLRLDFLPKGAVGFSIFDNFRRTLYTRNFASLESYTLNTNRSGASIGIHPGGRALDMNLGYAYTFNIFDDFEDLNFNFHELRFLTTWRFYPSTVAFVEVLGQLRDWRVGSSESNLHGSGDRSFIDSKPLRAVAGLNGFLTKKLALLLKVGYGNSFHDEGGSFSHVIGHGELAAKITNTVLLAVGFQRDFEDSFYANYYVENRSYLRMQATIAKRFSIEIYGDFMLRDFAEYDPAVPGVFISHKERRDQLVTGHAKLDVDLVRWVSLSVGYEIETNFTNYRIEHTILTSEGAVQIPDVGKYIRHQVYGSVNVQY